MEIKHILVPADLSERSELAAQHAALLAGRFNSRVTFLHAIAPSPYEYAAFGEGFYSAAGWPKSTEIEDGLRQRLEKLRERAAPNVEADIAVQNGDPAAVIEAAVRERGVDMLVMPTHGYGPFRKFMLGSVTSKVLHDVDCPVFTGVHVPEAPAASDGVYRRVACALDLSDHSKATLAWAHGFARAWEADFSVIHAAPRVDLGATYGDWIPQDTRQQIERQARVRVETLIRDAGIARAEVHVASADPVAYVAEQAEAFNADVLVIWRTEHSGVMGRRRSDAFALIREAPCSVISV